MTFKMESLKVSASFCKRRSRLLRILGGTQSGARSDKVGRSISEVATPIFVIVSASQSIRSLHSSIPTHDTKGDCGSTLLYSPWWNL